MSESTPEYTANLNLPYNQMKYEAVNVVKLAAILRDTMIAKNFRETFANEVAEAFLWHNLGLGGGG